MQSPYAPAKQVPNVGLRAELLSWYDANQRQLPWRGGDAYAVVVSEFMLQQTRVETVLKHWVAWMARFPDFDALAAASADDVQQAWAGLGYYRRARALHAVARAVADGGLPRSADELQGLPGVGPYTAAALASILHGEAAAAVDGNVERIVSRLADIREDVTGPGKAMIQEAATALLETKRPGDWNQAMMELGALVCKPTPDCPHCPVQGHCKAFAAGDPETLPLRPARRPPRTESVHFALIMQGDKLLLVKRPPGLLEGAWALPGGSASTPLARLVQQQTGLIVQTAKVAGAADHTFTHRRWEMRVSPASVLDVTPAGKLEAKWVKLTDLPDMGLATAVRKSLLCAQVPC